MRSQGNSKGACGCLCFVLKFTANIFIQSSASLSIGSCHLATLCWGGAEKETWAQLPPQGFLSHREKLRVLKAKAGPQDPPLEGTVLYWPLSS